MRVFFWGLLLLNTGFLAWQFWLNPEITVPSQDELDVGTHEKIVLYRETQAISKSEKKSQVATRENTKISKTHTGTPVPVVTKSIVSKQKPDKRDRTEGEKTGPSKVSSENSKACFILGAYSKESALQQALQALRNRGYEVSVVPAKLIIERYWVFIPSLSSLDEARKVTRELRSHGIEDYQILATEGKVNAISLGVYSNHDTAISRQDEVSQMGYTPEIEVIKRQRAAKSLRITTGSNREESEKMVNELARKEKGLKIDKIPCQ